jgi:hypothetical protein
VDGFNQGRESHWDLIIMIIVLTWCECFSHQLA